MIAEWFASHGLHLVLLAIYLAIIAHHAMAGKRGVRTLDDYLVAGRGLGGLVIGLSFYATFMSTNTFIGAAGKSWDVGLIWCLGGTILVTLCCLSWFVVAPRFGRENRPIRYNGSGYGNEDICTPPQEFPDATARLFADAGFGSARRIPVDRTGTAQGGFRGRAAEGGQRGLRSTSSATPRKR